jgi:hypothetical protein
VLCYQQKIAVNGFLRTLRKWKSDKLVATPFYILFGSVGAVVGILDACCGLRFDVREIPKLSRGAESAPLRPPVESRASSLGRR